MAGILKNLRDIHMVGSETRQWMTRTERKPESGPVHMRVAGFTEARGGYDIERLTPPFSVVLIGEAGEGRVWLDGAWHRCPPDHAYVTSPGVPHALRVPSGGRWRLHWALYMMPGTLPTLDPGCPPRLYRIDATGFRHAVEGLYHESVGPSDPGVVAHWSALVDRMVLRILDVDRGEPRLERLWRSIRMNVGAAWDLDRMAREVGVNVETLRRLCQQHVGRAPVAELTRLRMLAAADLLAYSSEKIAVIAAHVGYGDGFAFSTAFKREMGVSPKHFRQTRGRTA